MRKARIRRIRSSVRGGCRRQRRDCRMFRPRIPAMTPCETRRRPVSRSTLSVRRERTRRSPSFASPAFRLAENVGGVLVELAHREGVRRMEGERDHRPRRSKDRYRPRRRSTQASRLKLSVCLGTSVTHEVALGLSSVIQIDERHVVSVVMTSMPFRIRSAVKRFRRRRTLAPCSSRSPT